MPSPKKPVGLAVAILLSFALILSVLFVIKDLESKKTTANRYHGTVLDKPREINLFNLTDTNNRAFTNKNLKDQWTLVFFGFTSCGYVCPTTMADLNQMYQQLLEKQIQPLPQVVLVSIDPKRDDLLKLKRYVEAFNPHFLGARGEDEQIREMMREMGLSYKKTSAKDPDDSNYDVQHSSALILFNPQGELVAFFSSPHQVDALVEDYQQLVS